MIEVVPDDVSRFVALDMYVTGGKMNRVGCSWWGEPSGLQLVTCNSLSVSTGGLRYSGWRVDLYFVTSEV